MERLIGFAPSIDENCTTIILGSMPSVKSLEQQQYYAHPQNRFWKLMAIFFNNTNYLSRATRIIEKKSYCAMGLYRFLYSRR